MRKLRYTTASRLLIIKREWNRNRKDSFPACKAQIIVPSVFSGIVIEFDSVIGEAPITVHARCAVCPLFCPVRVVGCCSIVPLDHFVCRFCSSENVFASFCFGEKQINSYLKLEKQFVCYIVAFISRFILAGYRMFVQPQMNNLTV